MTRKLNFAPSDSFLLVSQPIFKQFPSMSPSSSSKMMANGDIHLLVGAGPGNWELHQATRFSSCTQPQNALMLNFGLPAPTTITANTTPPVAANAYPCFNIRCHTSICPIDTDHQWDPKASELRQGQKATGMAPALSLLTTAWLTRGTRKEITIGPT